MALKKFSVGYRPLSTISKINIKMSVSVMLTYQQLYTWWTEPIICRTIFPWGSKKCTQNFGRRTVVNGLLGTRSLSMEEKSKINLEEIRCESFGWIQLAQDIFQWLDFVDIVLNIRVP